MDGTFESKELDEFTSVLKHKEDGDIIIDTSGRNSISAVRVMDISRMYDFPQNKVWNYYVVINVKKKEIA